MYDYTRRKSIRKYSSKPVDNSMVVDLLREASHTQTMGNLQLYSVIITRDEASKKALAPAHFYQPMVENASVVLTFCADTTGQPSGVSSAKQTPDMIISYHSRMQQQMPYSIVRLSAIWQNGKD